MNSFKFYDLLFFKRVNKSQVKENSDFKSILPLIDKSHRLYYLENKINWEVFIKRYSSYYRGSNNCDLHIRRMVAFHYLKYLYDMTDNVLLHTWLENVYWQFFTGEKYFQSRLVIIEVDLMIFRKNIQEEGLLAMFKDIYRMVKFNHKVLPKEYLN